MEPLTEYWAGVGIALALVLNAITLFRLWADATKNLVKQTGQGDYSLAIKVISENNNIPVILVDDCDSILETRNFQKLSNSWIYSKYF